MADLLPGERVYMLSDAQKRDLARCVRLCDGSVGYARLRTGRSLARLGLVYLANGNTPNAYLGWRPTEAGKLLVKGEPNG